MNHYRIYHDEIPAFLEACMRTPVVRRLQKVGMNCGCEYTSFPRFTGLTPYSRYDHSVGVALIAWHFTHDPAQAVAGLLHDVATPVFAHVVDFMRGDYLTQESTEDGTEALIAGSEELQAVLAGYGLTTDDVCDYHRYPIADNDTPRLSADRLEYTLGNCVNFGIRTMKEVKRFYGDLAVGTNEDGQAELLFNSLPLAEDFARATLACSRIYVSDEDRYAMQMLSELLRHAIERGIIDGSDLLSTEPEVIDRLLADEEIAGLWRGFRGYRKAEKADRPGTTGDWRRIDAKKRYVDPMVNRRGRVSGLSAAFAEELRAFKDASLDDWICGEA